MEDRTPASPTLLLIADDLMFPSRVREGLRPLGYHLLVAATAEEAVRRASATPAPIAILINLTARRYDPLDLISLLKSEPQTRLLPILGFAGHMETAKHQAARKAGADRTAANSSVALHLSSLIERLLHPTDKEGAEDVLEDEAPEA